MIESCGFNRFLPQVAHADLVLDPMSPTIGGQAPSSPHLYRGYPYPASRGVVPVRVSGIVGSQ